MKVTIWANSPSPHQADFYHALRQSGVDLQVVYLAALAKSRLEMGWKEAGKLPANEYFLPDKVDPFQIISDWQERVHIIPGYSRLFYLSLIGKLSRTHADWVHWSENSQPTWRSYISWGLKKWYANQVNRFALGAFAHGDSASVDFERWGIQTEKIAHLYYSIAGVTNFQVRDQATADFVNRRQAFVYIGSFNRNKAVMKLLQSFARVGRNSNTCLVLVGNGPLEQQCRDFLIANNLQRQVLFRGVVERNSIGAVLNCCNTLVLPSLYDGWGVVLNEAASAGLALIASNSVGAARHLITPGWNGFRVQAGNVDSLSVAMGAYAQNPLLAAMHGKHSTLQYVDYTPSANVERFLSTITAWKATAAWQRQQTSALAVHDNISTTKAAA